VQGSCNRTSKSKGESLRLGTTGITTGTAEMSVSSLATNSRSAAAAAAGAGSADTAMGSGIKTQTVSAPTLANK
jgi:hypothetical protein